MALINIPPIVPGTVDETGLPSRAMSNWMMKVFRLCFDTQNSGTTAQRPTANLYPGKFYFDTSLGANGKPIWVNKASTGWVLADGTAA